MDGALPFDPSLLPALAADPPPSPLLGLLVVAGIAAVGLALLLAERRFLSPRLILTPEDVATCPGRSIVLRAWVERDLLPLWDPPIRGIEVRFRRGDTLHTATTGPDGKAEITVSPLEPGLYTIRVECDLAPANELIVEVADRPALVVDIDQTIAVCSQATFLFSSTEHVKAMDGAAETLQSLAARHRIVYLTARDHLLRDRTREWLRLRGFPEAPLLVRRERLWSMSARRHKITRLAEIAPQLRLVAGIGDLEGDVEAYKSQNMKAVRFGQDVKTWAEVPAKLP